MTRHQLLTNVSTVMPDLIRHPDANAQDTDRQSHYTIPQMKVTQPSAGGGFFNPASIIKMSKLSIDNPVILSEMAQLGVVSAQFGVLWEQFGFVLDNFGVIPDTFGNKKNAKQTHLKNHPKRRKPFHYNWLLFTDDC